MEQTAPRKYTPLGTYLAGQPAGVATLALTLAEVERLVGAPLPSAGWTRGFWANVATVPRCRSWLEAGWYVARYDRWRGVVTFARGAAACRNRARSVIAAA